MKVGNNTIYLYNNLMTKKIQLLSNNWIVKQVDVFMSLIFSAITQSLDDLIAYK